MAIDLHAWEDHARKDAIRMRFSDLLDAFLRAREGEYESALLRSIYADELDRRWALISKEGL
jgi:hypothetical protein